MPPLNRAPGRSKDAPDSLQLQMAQMSEMLKSLVHDMKDVKSDVGKLKQVSFEQTSDFFPLQEVGDDDKDSDAIHASH